MAGHDDCIFCKLVAGEIPSHRVFEDDDAVAFMDISPLNPGHLLVVPRAHHAQIFDIEPALYGRLATVAAHLAGALRSALAPDGLNVLQLNGEAANQVVPHVHFHLVPRWDGDGLEVSRWNPVAGDMTAIAETAARIREQITG